MATVYKAQWPLSSTSGLMEVLIYEADVPHHERNNITLDATGQIWSDVFQGKYVKVFFEGLVTKDGTLVVEKFVRQDEWLDYDPLTGEKVFQ